MFAIVFVNQAGTTQGEAFTSEGPMFFLVLSSVFDTIFPMLTVFPQTRTLVVREFRNTYYDLLPYYLAQLTCFISLNAVYAVFLAVPPYFAIGYVLEAANFFIFFAVLMLMSSIGVAFGLVVGSRCDTIDDAFQMILPSLVPM